MLAIASPTLSPGHARAITVAKAAASLRNGRFELLDHCKRTGIQRRRDLPKSARLLGLELLDRCKRSGLCSPSVASLGEALGYDERTIRRGIADLMQLGLLQVIKRGGQLTDQYNLLIGKLAAMADTIASHVQSVCTAAARAAAAARAHAKAKAANIIQTARAARTAAIDAARAARERLRTTPPPIFQKPSKSGPVSSPDRTFCPRIPSKVYNNIGKGLSNFAAKSGFWKAQGTPQGQHLTDEQLDRKAHARLSEGLLKLGEAAIAQFYARPDAEQLEAEAIRAERYKPGTGLAFLADRLRHEALA
jgi:hypothetical protein